MMEVQAEMNVSAYGLTPVEADERNPDGGPLLSQVELETVLSSYPDVNLVLGQNFDQGRGSLYVTTR